MKAEIVSIGTEILLGHIINTNTSYLSKKLAGIGIDVFYHTAVGDNPGRLRETITKAMGRSDIVITTGGLGPTVDDITLQTVANVTAKGLVFRQDILKQIRNNFRHRGYKMPKEAKRQAFVPEGAIPLRNDVGTAPGLIIEMYDKLIIALPGPPRELQPIVERSVIPYLRKKGPSSYVIKSRVLKLTGLAESQVNAKVKDLLNLSGSLTIGIYAHVGQVDLKITCKESSPKKADREISKIEKKIRKRFRSSIFGTDSETLQDVVGKALSKKKKSVAIAESCTGGYISNLVTNTPGSSKYFVLGVTAYSNNSKINLLGVEKELIKKYGAVSKEVAKVMARNVRALAKTDFGIGVTGIAGPKGGTKAKPVGTVYIALARKNKILLKRYCFIGTREEIKLQTAQQTLNLLRLECGHS